jgi:hypothetical protein
MLLLRAQLCPPGMLTGSLWGVLQPCGASYSSIVLLVCCGSCWGPVTGFVPAAVDSSGTAVHMRHECLSTCRCWVWWWVFVRVL